MKMPCHITDGRVEYEPEEKAKPEELDRDWDYEDPINQEEE